MRLWQYLSAIFLANWRILSLDAALGFLMAVVIPQVVALVQREIFNNLTGDANVSLGIWELCAVLVAIAVAQFPVTLAGSTVNRATNVMLACQLQRNAFSHLVYLPGSRPLPSSAGEAVNRFFDDTRGSGAYVARFSFVAQYMVFGAIALYFMVRISPLITFAVFLPILIVMAIISIASRPILLTNEASRKATGAVTGFIAEAFGMVEAIKVANAEERAIDRFNVLNRERQRTALRDTVISQTLQAVSQNVANIGTGLILILAGQAMRQGSFTVGDLSLFVFYLSYTQQLSVHIGAILIDHKRVRVSRDRLLALMLGAPAKTLVEASPGYLLRGLPKAPFIEKTIEDRLDVLEVKGLTYVHPESGLGVSDVNLKLRRGSFTVVTGRIGAGKTTLLRALIGWLPHQAGEIRWNGAVVDEPDKFLMPPRRRYTSQVPRLFSEELRSNILMGLPEERVDLPGAVVSAVMEQDVEELEKGLDTIVEPKGVKLSGGQQRRSGAARMFVREPELLILDDLSSGLDVETEQTLWARLFERKDSTALVVSHRRTALRHADHVVVL